MNVAVIGASGRAGSHIVAEMVSRGHSVTGIARHRERIADLPGVTAKQGDVFDPQGVAALIAGHDAVVNSVRFADSEPQLLIGAVRASGVKRYIVVGGAGSLRTGPDKLEMNGDHMPPAARENSRRGGMFLDLLRNTDDLDWTFISPSRMFVPGERTGAFRYGKDELLFDANGDSRISFEDFALALVGDAKACAATLHDRILSQTIDLQFSTRLARVRGFPTSRSKKLVRRSRRTSSSSCKGSTSRRTMWRSIQNRRCRCLWRTACCSRRTSRS